MSDTAAVQQWFSATDQPKRALMQSVREAILDADERVTEAIKWKSPTFMFDGNIASISP